MTAHPIRKAGILLTVIAPASSLDSAVPKMVITSGRLADTMEGKHVGHLSHLGEGLI